VQYYLTVETFPSGIAAISGAGWYNATASVTLTAPAVPGYTFTYWDVDGPSQGTGVNPITVTMDAPHTATAHYSSLTSPLTVSISPQTITISLGGSVSFTSTVTGGTSPYTYQWYVDGNAVPGAKSSNWLFTPTAAGTYYVYVTVTDANGNTASSTLARVLVIGAAPVGGYAVSFTEHEPTGADAAAYLILIVLFSIVLTIIKRKRK
jgi:PKD repeat protein